MPHADDTARRLSQTGTSLYAVLELKKGAQPEEIKRAYRFRLSPSFNPDKNPGDTQAGEFFKEINTAHAVLSDPTKKKIYDQHGSLGIYLLDHFGEEGVRYYFIANSCWFKTLVILCCLLTCCCCCCCCCFCCGALSPPPEEVTKKQQQNVYCQQPNVCSQPKRSGAPQKIEMEDEDSED
ncbi:dnaJ homolog subfamily C member 5G isoform X3 [Peromyscus eremicus]|uniref:dnaJ homolog subfamily C member 5G isoform X3 n=1 Tax=Peromyscus eremicus TaxID=42410 RepID=UPI0027DB9F46|nr:dnaJ homolog subfamily C member 5G isoform X3 [Peromyscus eremicus]